MKHRYKTIAGAVRRIRRIFKDFYQTADPLADRSQPSTLNSQPSVVSSLATTLRLARAQKRQAASAKEEAQAAARANFRKASKLF